MPSSTLPGAAFLASASDGEGTPQSVAQVTRLINDLSQRPTFEKTEVSKVGQFPSPPPPPTHLRPGPPLLFGLEDWMAAGGRVVAAGHGHRLCLRVCWTVRMCATLYMSGQTQHASSR